MIELYFAYPGDLSTPSGGYGYDRRIIAELRGLGWQVDLVPLGDGFPAPDAATLASAAEQLMALPKGAAVVVDGLAYGVLEQTERLGAHLHLLALVHHPLCLETGLDGERASALRASERAALADACHVIVTSPSTADLLRELFGTPCERISTVLPGTDRGAPRVPTDPASEGKSPLSLLCVGTLVPRKGHDLLLDALAGLSDIDWWLDCVGGLDADPVWRDLILARCDKLGLSQRVRFHGAVPAEDLSAFYAGADIFVLASRYEGYGMAYAEALANGLPVIGSGGGAVRGTLPEQAAIYCPPDDPDALRAALGRLMADPGERTRLGVAALKAAEDLPDWDESARLFARAIEDSLK